jgi:hypothetical protein
LKLKNTYTKPCFVTASLSKNVNNLVQHKLAQNVFNSQGYLIFTKKNNGLQKVAQFAKIVQSGHTVDYSKSGFIFPVANFIKLSWRYLRS